MSRLGPSVFELPDEITRSFISTMETETIASRNVVDLLLHEEFGSGICGSLISGSDADVPENITRVSESSDFVLGWDC